MSIKLCQALNGNSHPSKISIKDTKEQADKGDERGVWESTPCAELLHELAYQKAEEQQQDNVLRGGVVCCMLSCQFTSMSIHPCI